MKQKKSKGISLIVLIITIVLIIVLATAIIVNLVQTNIIDNANKSVQKNNELMVNEKAQLIMIDYLTQSRQGIALEEILQHNKELKEIDDYELKEDETYRVIISDYYVIMDGKNFNVSKAKICSEIEISYIINEIKDGKVSVKVTIMAVGGSINKVKNEENRVLTYNKEKQVEIDEEITPNKSYNYEITLSNGNVLNESIIYEDKEAPTVSIDIENKLFFSNSSEKNVNANIIINDNKSGIDLENCKWILSTESNKGVLAEDSYTGTFSNANETITTSISTAGSYYIHILVKDNVGNKDEIISEKIELKSGYKISTPDELQAMGSNLAANYYIVNDIDMKDYSFQTIGGTFTGTIDGMGHTISNLNISKCYTMPGFGYKYTGIFYKLSGNVTINNILFKDVNIDSSAYGSYGTAIIAGSMESGNVTFKNVGITGNVYGNASFLASSSTSGTVTFNNCYARVNITNSTKNDVGGFIACDGPYTSTVVNNCYFSGTIGTTWRTGSFRGGWGLSNDNNQNTSKITVTNSYYNKTLFTLSVPEESSGIGLETEDMKLQSSYNGWDFEKTWYMGSDGYPELKF